ncbi:hypothetical protein ACFLXE_08975 [Chloroflexota bacterium]
MKKEVIVPLSRKEYEGKTGSPTSLNPWIRGSIQTWIVLRQAATQVVIGLEAGLEWAFKKSPEVSGGDSGE